MDAHVVARRCKPAVQIARDFAGERLHVAVKPPRRTNADRAAAHARVPTAPSRAPAPFRSARRRDASRCCAASPRVTVGQTLKRRCLSDAARLSDESQQRHDIRQASGSPVDVAHNQLRLTFNSDHIWRVSSYCARRITRLSFALTVPNTPSIDAHHMNDKCIFDFGGAPTVDTSTSHAPEDLVQRHARPGMSLVAVLHAIQDEAGFVPPMRSQPLARAMNLSRAEVHGVITYYHHFRTHPAAPVTVQLCRAEACRSNGHRSARAAHRSAHRLPLRQCPPARTSTRTSARMARSAWSRSTASVNARCRRR